MKNVSSDIIFYLFDDKIFIFNSLTLVQVSTKVVKFSKNVPKLDNIFIAQSASVIGKAEIQANSSVWYGAVIRGNHSIRKNIIQIVIKTIRLLTM